LAQRSILGLGVLDWSSSLCVGVVVVVGVVFVGLEFLVGKTKMKAILRPVRL
jgi:hypothetical protein